LCEKQGVNPMTDRELLELIANQVINLTTQVDTLTKDVGEMKVTMATKQELAEMKTAMATKQELAEVKTIVVKIENDHGQKLGALFDGYKLISERLESIEDKVSKHEEIISRRIR
jgi:hypothetical protein